MVTTKKAATPVKEAVAKRITAKAAGAAAPGKAKPAAKVASEGPKKPAVRKKAAAPVVPALSAAQRAHYVEVAAFYIAERRGFAGANPADDWIAAEAEIDRLVATGHFAH